MPNPKPDPIIITRTLAKRAWSDIEPKIALSLASGSAATGILAIINAYGFHLPLTVQNGIPVACAILAGYLTPSVGLTSTVRHGDDFVVEKHSGNVEITTNAIPIQRPAGIVEPTIEVAPYQNRPGDKNSGTFQFQDVKSVPENQKPTQAFTEVISPDRARADAFISQLPSSGGTPAAIHDENDDDTPPTLGRNNWGN